MIRLWCYITAQYCGGQSQLRVKYPSIQIINGIFLERAINLVFGHYPNFFIKEECGFLWVILIHIA